MIQLRGGHTTQDPRLGRLPPSDWEHVEKYPLTAATAPSKPVPVVLGINWYSNFDSPVKDGRTWWIGRGDLGSIRGGHGICVKPHGVDDLATWWAFYDQGQEGRCVEFAWHRCMTLLNRHRFDIWSRWAYWEMQRGDEWEGGSYPGAQPVYEGTSVRSGGEVGRTKGFIRATRGKPAGTEGNPAEGIAAYRWPTDWNEVRTVLGIPNSVDGVPLLNSWGRYGYPHIVRLTDEAGARILGEDGEAAIPTDR